ncbi:DUF5681 domain-containing protein [Rhodococcus rhodochrous]|uniref:DUF5681 domain-containing protein n=1 Tax=Rhodococcus rhodochrous TaxID=1829 RepID=UPI00178021E5|nr:DUF5681 domain-containing protein [Rhodococcus rhodochrous]QOH56238.1 hypothetical protein C6Y44_09880 [Rhodococcus rhodochrous]
MAAGGKSGGEQADNLPIRRTGRFGDDKDPNMGKDTQFKPGQSGNPKGGPKGKKLSTVIQEMLNDESFIERLAEKLPDNKKPDPDFQGTPMKAIVATAIIESFDPSGQYKARAAAREWIGKYGFGTKIDVTSDGERVEVAPLVISSIKSRGTGDAAAETEEEAS